MLSMADVTFQSPEALGLANVQAPYRGLRRSWLLMVFANACSVLLCPRASPAELALVHGHIYTANPRAPWAQAVLVSGTRIEAIGTDAQVLGQRSGARL